MQKRPTLSFIEHFKDLPDPRVNRTQDHGLIDVKVIAVYTMLCGGESFNDMEDFARPRRSGSRPFSAWLPVRHPRWPTSTDRRRLWTRAGHRGREVGAKCSVPVRQREETQTMLW